MIEKVNEIQKIKKWYLYMKQIFSSFVLFIIILNSGCGKNAFFYTTRRSIRFSPAPLAPPIGSKPFFISNKHLPGTAPFIYKYMNMPQAPHIKPPNMTHVSYLSTANINPSDVTDLRSDPSLILPKNVKIPDMTHVSYLNTVNINTTDVTNLRSDPSLISSQNIKIPNMVHVPYTNPVHVNPSDITDLKSDISLLPLNNIKTTNLIYTSSYMDRVHINAPDLIDLKSYPAILPKNVKIPNTIHTFYMDPVRINTSDIVDLKSNSNLIPSKNIETSNMIHTPSYINSIRINPSDVIYLQPGPKLSLTKNVKIQNKLQVYTNPINIDPSDIVDLKSDISSIALPEIQQIFDLSPKYNNRSSAQLVDVQPDIKVFPVTQPPPSPPHPPSKIIEKKSQHEFHDVFTYALSEDSFFQSTYNKNKTTLLFRAFDNYGLNIRDLQEDDIIVSENQREVENYTLASERQRLDHTLEVVFAIDTAASMGTYADDVKENIDYFVNKLQEAQIHASFCLVTFKDLVERKCAEFFPNAPDISKLAFNRGGHIAHTENALGGVLSASEAPWSVDSQRMVILATDASFWEKRDTASEHSEADTAPEYSTVLDELIENDIKVFALTQEHRGFSRNNFRDPSLVEATSGKWFNIKTLEGRTIESVFHHIRDQIDISYKIEYFVEDQERSDPFLSLENRQIVLTAREPEVNDIKIQIEDIYSNAPEGSRQLQSYWPLSQRAVVNEDRVFVTVDEQSEYNFLIENGGIFFPEPPSSDSKIFVQYEAGSLRDNVRKRPLLLQIDPQHQSSSDIQIASASLKLNDILVSDQDFEIKHLDSTDSMQLHLGENVFDNTDPYSIRDSGELRISLSYEVVSRHNSVN